MRTMTFSVLITATTAALGPQPATLEAQDRFGAAVAVRDGSVLVLKPGAGRGPAALYRYARVGGRWTKQEAFSASAGAATAEPYGASLAVAGDVAVVAGGDPDGRWGAHLFVRGAEGGWRREGRVPARGREPGVTAAGEPLDLGAVMRILQPPRRVVAASADALLVARPEAPEAGVRAYARTGVPGEWREAGHLLPPGGGAPESFGEGLAIEGETALVGAPEVGASGRAFAYAGAPDGSGWRLEAELHVADLAPEAGFGSALVLRDGTAWVGAPGRGEAAGVVVMFERDLGTGTWERAARLAAPDSVAGDRFGAAIAVGEREVWVGAPGAGGGQGRVYRFERAGDGSSGEGRWRPAGTLRSDRAGSGAGFGASVALGAGVGAVGAPGAGGGAVALFERGRGEAAWSEASWLRPAGDLRPVAGGRVRCADGEAAGFACRDVDLLAYLPVEGLGGGADERLSDLWGWTDPRTGREYALVGRTGGATFVDITVPTEPVYLGALPANRSGARDLKVFADHLFFTGDGADDHGLVVFDLTRLRDVRDPPVTFEPDARYTGIASAHNLVIDTESGFAYAVGASGGGETCGGGLHMIDIGEPTSPTFAGCYLDRSNGLLWPGRTHDAQCVVYRGPDAEHRGKQICLASIETALRIVDVTDKEAPVPIAAATYPGLAYVHQGWLTEDQRYFYLDDELDELVGRTARTRTLVWDLADLDDPVLVAEHRGATAATDHNLYVKGDRVYQANYQAGLRVLDIRDPERPVEVGFFDTTPYEGDLPGFNGAWTAFPWFESGTVIVSSMNEGLFVVRPRRTELVP